MHELTSGRARTHQRSYIYIMAVVYASRRGDAPIAHHRQLRSLPPALRTHAYREHAYTRAHTVLSMLSTRTAPLSSPRVQLPHSPGAAAGAGAAATTSFPPPPPPPPLLPDFLALLDLLLLLLDLLLFLEPACTVAS